MVSQEAGLSQWWPKESGKTNSKRPRDLAKNRYRLGLKQGQLPLSQGKMKKGDDVADDDG
jgi:hypothetical protein